MRIEWKVGLFGAHRVLHEKTGYHATSTMYVPEEQTPSRALSLTWYTLGVGKVNENSEGVHGDSFFLQVRAGTKLRAWLRGLRRSQAAAHVL